MIASGGCTELALPCKKCGYQSLDRCKQSDSSLLDQAKPIQKELFQAHRVPPSQLEVFITTARLGIDRVSAARTSIRPQDSSWGNARASEHTQRSHLQPASHQQPSATRSRAIPWVLMLSQKSSMSAKSLASLDDSSRAVSSSESL